MATLGAIKISQGCDYILVATITNADHTDAVPSYKDLTGFEARFRVNNKQLEPSPYIDIRDTVVTHGAAGSTCTITDAATGEITVALTPHTPSELPTNNPVGEDTILQANNMYSLAIVDTNVSPEVITKVIQGECYVEAEL